MSRILLRFPSLFLLPALACFIAASAPAHAQFPLARRKILFDRGWRFHLGDAPGADNPSFDDSTWRQLNLPHDWMIEGVQGANPGDMDGPFDKGSPAGPGGAYMDGGIGWYRKTFTMPPADQGNSITLLFDGAYMNADVWLNGRRLGAHPYGFTSFYYDIGNALKYGAGQNVLAVKLDVQQPSCRWYSGAGIYRDVWLVEAAPVHVPVWGTYITTPQVTPESARVRVQTIVENDGALPQQATLTTFLLAQDGARAGAATQSLQIPANGRATFDQPINVATPQLWSPDSPILYRAMTVVAVGGKPVDSINTPFGIRTFVFTKDKGFFINGTHVPIQGVCDHHDLGALGAAVYPRGLQRQLEILKTMGCNAIRTSHNPPDPELLDLCDQMGFLVMDEAFDEWKLDKRKFGYGQFFDQWSQPDLLSMIDRDRNHPSIILWSIGNEVVEGVKGLPQAGPMAQRLVAICHNEDPTRPVTSACPNPSNAWKSGLARALNVFGINYSSAFYQTNSPQSQANSSGNPNTYSGQLPMVASETQSQVDTRGEYGITLDATGGVQIAMEDTAITQVSSYDSFRPGWTSTPDESFLALEHAPWVAGEFVWTGFDYLGEPTPYKWPARSSYFGIIDLAGFPKDRYYQFKAHWTNQPVVHLLPHWTWPGFEGKAIPVHVYTNADSVELFLNGNSLGSKNFPPIAKRSSPRGNTRSCPAFISHGQSSISPAFCKPSREKTAASLPPMSKGPPARP